MSYKQDNGYRSERSEYRAPFDWEFLGIILFFGAIVLSIVGLIVHTIAWENTTQTESACVVKDKTASSKSKGGTDYRIYTENCGVLTVGDDMFKGKWDSADRYSAIEVGKAYDFNTVGWRFPLLSDFPNVLTAKEVKK